MTHLPTGKKRHFHRHGKHYIWHPPKEEQTDATQFVETVEQNKKQFSQRQIKRAERVKALMLTLMSPTVNDMKKIIQYNLIKNNPCTLEDLKVAQAIWGPQIEPWAQKGKGTRKKPTPSTSDIFELPAEVKDFHREVHLFLDVMWVCGLPFLTSISENIMHRTATFLENRKISTLYNHLDEILHHYNRAGCRITKISADEEFEPMLKL